MVNENLQNNKIVVLYVCIDSSSGGSTKSLFELIKSVSSSVYPIVLFPERGDGYDFYVSQGIESYIHPFVKLYSFTKNRLVDVRKHPWRWHRVKKLRVDLGCAFFMRRALRRRKVDIVHTNTSPNDVGVYLSRILRAKHIWQIRESLDLHAGLQMYGGMSKLKRQMNHADARIVISSFLKEHWELVNHNTFLIPDAIFSKTDAVYSTQKEKYVLFISNCVTEAKGARKAILSFGLSRLSEDGFTLKIVGKCEEDFRESLMKTAREYQCDKAIEFLSFQADVRPLFEKASALIQLSEFEGLGRVVIEAMFYGCPVVAHASGGTLDLIDDGITGYLFTSISVCGERLRRVCLSDQRKIIVQAQEFAKNNFAVESFGPKLLDVYHTVLNQ